MRNFEERMHEIHRRSHARILRRRRQLTMLCMPLVAAAGVVGALKIHRPGVYQQTDITQPTIAIIQEYSNSLPNLTVEYIPKYTDREKVESIQTLIAGLVLIDEFTVDTTRTDSIHTQATSAHEIHKFILESEDGTTEYTLIGNTLADCSADVVYKLTDYQRVTLLNLLELPMK